jgi:acetyltransferase-like isoleucine patch superfamily enzyme
MAQFEKSTAIRTLLDERSGSAFQRYRNLTVGDRGLLYFIAYELACLLLLPLPGAVGLVLRKALFTPLLGGCGRGVVIGRNCVFRHPSNIHLDDGVVIDDECVLDARGTGAEGLRLGSNAIVSRGTILQSKGGRIAIGARCSIGAGSHLVSWSGLEIGADVAMAGDCSVSAGTYPLSEFSKRPTERTPVSAGPVVIGDGVWLATRVTILDAVRIGENAVVSAGSVVTSDVPARTVVQGNPARTIFTIR